MSSASASPDPATFTPQFPRTAYPEDVDVYAFLYPPVDLEEEVPWAARIATRLWSSSPVPPDASSSSQPSRSGPGDGATATGSAVSQLDRKLFVCAVLDTVLELNWKARACNDLVAPLPAWDDWHDLTDRFIASAYDLALETLSPEQRQQVPRQKTASRFLRLALNAHWDSMADSHPPGPRWTRELDAPDSDVERVIEPFRAEKNLDEVREIMKEIERVRPPRPPRPAGREVSEEDDYRLCQDVYYEEDDRWPLPEGYRPFRLWYDWSEDEDEGGDGEEDESEGSEI